MHRLEETIERGICIGCGACAIASGGAVKLVLSPTRLYQADLAGATESEIRAGSRVCPFSDESPNEDQLGTPNHHPEMKRHEQLGLYLNTQAGRVKDASYARDSSSGGLTSWTLTKAVEEGLVDAVISVGRPQTSSPELFSYGISADPENPHNRKSHYYASTMVDVLNAVQDQAEAKFAIVGIPCYIRAVRALVVEKPHLATRITLFVSLVCGHLKTQAYAESLAWQVGVDPDDLADVDFRVKDSAAPASDYRFAARNRSTGEWRTKPTRDLVGGSWGHNAFQPEACNFCDDVVGETADVSFGDAWLPQFVSDSRGTNIVITRNPAISTLLNQGVDDGEIDLSPLTPDEAATSQAGGFRHRRQGLAIRLADDLAKGLSVPRKRVRPNAHAVGPTRANLLRQRRRMAALSHTLFAEARRREDLSIYLTGMRTEIQKYRKMDQRALKTLLHKGKRLLRRIFTR